MPLVEPTTTTPARRGRGRLLRAVLTATLGAALVAPGALVTPAGAGILDPIVDPLTPILDPVTGLLLTAPEPVIAPGGAGQITLFGQVVCESDGTVAKACGALPLGAVTGATTALLLEAVPADPADVPVWDDTCAPAIGAVCVLPLDLLSGSPLGPVLEFVTPPETPGGTQAPDTTITSSPPAAYATSHRFTFTAGPTTAATYRCRLQVTFRGAPPAGAHRGDSDWVACSSGRTYTGLAPADYVFAVKAGTGDPGLEDPTPATQTFRLTAPPVPQTTVVAGPRSGAWLLGNRVTYRFRSSVAGATFACRYDGALQGSSCDDGEWSVRSPRPGSHVLTVAARAHGVSDPTAARRLFHVPLDDRQLRGVGRWVDARQRGAFRTTVRATRVHGAALATRGRIPVKRVVLVADRGRGHGTVKVFLGNRLLRKVSLHAKRSRPRQLIPVATFRGVRTGRVRLVVVSSGRPVRIDGLGVARR